MGSNLFSNKNKTTEKSVIGNNTLNCEKTGLFSVLSAKKDVITHCRVF
jgi:hypothetical protein